MLNLELWICSLRTTSQRFPETKCLCVEKFRLFLVLDPNQHPTVDGSEIRRSPVEGGSLSHYLQGFSTIPGGDRRISEPSTVCQAIFR